MGGIGSLGNLGVQTAGQLIGMGISSFQAKEGYKYWKKQKIHGPSLAAEGLERAGLNRILAAGGGLGASTAGSAVKINPAGMGGGSGVNPSLASGQRKLLTEQTRAAGSAANQADANADLSRTNNLLQGLLIPHAKALNDFYTSEHGIRTLETGEVNKALPSNFPAAGIRGAAGAMEIFRKFTNPGDPYQSRRK